MKGKKFLKCDCFLYRDVFKRNIEATEFTTITHKELLEAISNSHPEYAKRSVERFLSADKEVVRVGLELGIKLK